MREQLSTCCKQAQQAQQPLPASRPCTHPSATCLRELQHFIVQLASHRVVLQPPRQEHAPAGAQRRLVACTGQKERGWVWAWDACTSTGTHDRQGRRQQPALAPLAPREPLASFPPLPPLPQARSPADTLERLRCGPPSARTAPHSAGDRKQSASSRQGSSDTWQRQGGVGVLKRGQALAHGAQALHPAAAQRGAAWRSRFRDRRADGSLRRARALRTRGASLITSPGIGDCIAGCRRREG